MSAYSVFFNPGRIEACRPFMKRTSELGIPIYRAHLFIPGVSLWFLSSVCTGLGVRVGKAVVIRACYCHPTQCVFRGLDGSESARPHFFVILQNIEYFSPMGGVILPHLYYLPPVGSTDISWVMFCRSLFRQSASRPDPEACSGVSRVSRMIFLQKGVQTDLESYSSLPRRACK